MNTIYFDDEISGLPFRVTESYVQYGSEVIPTSSISYFTVKKAVASWLPVIVLFLGGIVSICLGYAKISIKWDNILQLLGLFFLVGSVIAAIIVFLENRKRYLFISSHSQHSIEVWIQGSKYNKNYEPLLKALFNAIEGKNPNNNSNDIETPV